MPVKSEFKKDGRRAVCRKCGQFMCVKYPGNITSVRRMWENNQGIRLIAGSFYPGCGEEAKLWNPDEEDEEHA